MYRETVRSYLLNKAEDREEDTEGEVEVVSKFKPVKGQPHPSSVKVKPKWVVVRRKQD